MLNFEDLTLDKKEQYEQYYRACPQKSSNTSFFNLWAWEEEYHAKIAFDGDLCWLRFFFQNDKEGVYGPPIGDWDKIDWKLKLADKLEQGAKFVRVPEVLAEKINEAFDKKLKLISDRDNWEYVYQTEDLRKLVGEKFRNQRKASNQFMQNNEYKFSFFGAEKIEEIRLFQERWMSQAQVLQKDFDLHIENTAIMRVLDHWSVFGDKIFGAYLEVGGELVAYTVGEKQDAHNLIIHYEKALYDVKGAYPAINRLTLEQLPEYTFVNREEDLGLSGLRKIKLEYNPTGFVKKYEISIG